MHSILILILGVIALFHAMLPNVVYGQDKYTKPATVVHDDHYFDLPIPDQFCNETERLFGKVMLQQLEPLTKQMAGLLNPKIVFRQCENTKILPWGYVSIGPKIGIAINQEELNKILINQLGKPEFIDSVQDLILNEVEEDIGISLGEFKTNSPKVMINDHVTLIFATEISNKKNGAEFTQLSITSSTLINNRTIDYHTYIDADDANQVLENFVKAIYNNAKNLKALNPNQ